MTPFLRNRHIFQPNFLFLHKNIYCCALEACHWGTSNWYKYPQYMFSWRNKKVFTWCSSRSGAMILITVSSHGSRLLVFLWFLTILYSSEYKAIKIKLDMCPKYTNALLLWSLPIWQQHLDAFSKTIFQMLNLICYTLRLLAPPQGMTWGTILAHKSRFWSG